MKEQLAAGLREWQVAELVEDDEVHAREIFGEPALAVGSGLVLQPGDEIDDSVEAAAGAAADAAAGNGDGEMRFAGAGAADQHGVALLGEEGAGGEIADQAFVDRRAGKGEAVEILGSRRSRRRAVRR